MALTHLQVCEAVVAARGDAIVVCTMTAMNVLDALGAASPLTLSSVPLMGGALSLGLGLSLARPERTVLVLDGDSSLLMELGGLANVAAQQPRNLHHVVFANRVQFNANYALPLADGGRADFAGLARAAGYASAQTWSRPEDIAPERIAAHLRGAGPSFVQIDLEPSPSRLGPAQPAPETTDARFSRMGDEIRAIRSALGVAA
jgi:thiamine pyrophosphate-dependent acetolactate synthase large subunit-like protein